MYRAIINLEPLVLNVLNVAYIVTRKCSIHDIQMNYHSIKPIDRGFVTCPTHTWGQVQNLWEPNTLIELAKFTRL